jgi:hypothetical protein
MGFPTWKRARVAVVESLDPLSKLAQIAAVVIAGVWAYRSHMLSGEDDLVPEVFVSTQVVAYSEDKRLLVVHIQEKNVGKVPIKIDRDALTLTVKKIPQSLGPGYVKIDGQPALFQEKHMLRRYDEGLYLSPGTEQHDVAEFVVLPGIYSVEAVFSLPDGDTIGDSAFQRVD